MNEYERHKYPCLVNNYPTKVKQLRANYLQFKAILDKYPHWCGSIKPPIRFT